MEKEFTTFLTAQSMTATSSKTSFKAKELSLFPQDSTKALSIKAKCKATEYLPGKTDPATKASTKTTKNTEKANTLLLKANNTKAVGKTESDKEKEFSPQN